jgi:hypothetical protein
MAAHIDDIVLDPLFCDDTGTKCSVAADSNAAKKDNETHTRNYGEEAAITAPSGLTPAGMWISSHWHQCNECRSPGRRLPKMSRHYSETASRSVEGGRPRFAELSRPSPAQFHGSDCLPREAPDRAALRYARINTVKNRKVSPSPSRCTQSHSVHNFLRLFTAV